MYTYVFCSSLSVSDYCALVCLEAKGKLNGFLTVVTIENTAFTLVFQSVKYERVVLKFYCFTATEKVIFHIVCIALFYWPRPLMTHNLL